ncbi:ABC transporter ATP-binding protein [Futiania mangrovi]|uniref:ABC transporter ATP-binding protein n=1 Tax=Futiania mangrovi TaxID=2959716 RepID=A0A9J6PD07_9PROT|nr:ABC transporter ATP-binding protein [Futiania mangrovii]MCP1336465.1 ABC transporter ATP-binding protein [Futiania mangrovii]
MMGLQSSSGPDASPAIRVRGLAKRFEAVRAVDGVSFDLARGETLALLGGNGAGKTTTISMLLGLIIPSGGTIEVLGHDMATSRHLALARVNFQSPYVDLPRRLTVRQNLAVYARLYGVPDVAGRIAELARDLDLAGFLDRPAGQLSAGQKTRVGLAKALINTPEILFLDEPTASLDPDTADWVRSYLERYRSAHGAAILLASHNMHEVERLADRVLMMKGGRVVDEGPPAALIERYGRRTMEEVFLAIARGEPMPPLPEGDAAAQAGDGAPGGQAGRRAAV